MEKPCPKVGALCYMRLGIMSVIIGALGRSSRNITNRLKYAGKHKKCQER